MFVHVNGNTCIKSLPEGEQVLAELKPAKLDRAILNIIKRTFKEKKLNRGFYTSPIIANNHASLIRSFRQIFPSGLLIKLGLSIVLFSIWIMSCLNWYYSEKNRIDDLDIKFRRISTEEEYLELRLKAFDDEDSRIYHKERKKQCNFTTNSSSDSKQWCKFETDYGALGKEKIAKERAAISSKKKSTEESLIKEKSNFNRSKKEFVGHVMIGGITNLIQIFTGSHHR